MRRIFHSMPFTRCTEVKSLLRTSREGSRTSSNSSSSSSSSSSLHCGHDQFRGTLYKLYALDLETTVDGQKKIIELAIVPCNDPAAESIPREASYASLVNPGIRFRHNRFSDISFEDVQFQPNTKVVLQTAASILHAAVQDGYVPVLVAHNGVSFDFRILEYEAQEAGVPFPSYIPLDTLLLSKTSDLQRRLGLENLKQGTLVKHFQASQNVAHRALADAEGLASILPQLLHECGGGGAQTWQDLIQQALDILARPRVEPPPEATKYVTMPRLSGRRRVRTTAGRAAPAPAQDPHLQGSSPPSSTVPPPAPPLQPHSTAGPSRPITLPPHQALAPSPPRPAAPLPVQPDHLTSQLQGLSLSATEQAPAPQQHDGQLQGGGQQRFEAGGLLVMEAEELQEAGAAGQLVLQRKAPSTQGPVTMFNVLRGQGACPGQAQLPAPAAQRFMFIIRACKVLYNISPQPQSFRSSSGDTYRDRMPAWSVTLSAPAGILQAASALDALVAPLVEGPQGGKCYRVASWVARRQQAPQQGLKLHMKVRLDNPRLGDGRRQPVLCTKLLQEIGQGRQEPIQMALQAMGGNDAEDVEKVNLRTLNKQMSVGRLCDCVVEPRAWQSSLGAGVKLHAHTIIFHD